MTIIRFIYILRLILILILLNQSYNLSAQKTFQSTEKISINGYIKSLQNWQFHDNGDVLSNQLLHNRLNVKWNIHSSLVIAGEWRTRIISGHEMKLQSDFMSMLRNPNDKWDLSVAWLSKPDLIILSNTERLWMSYAGKKWFARAGRQRINWSTATTWNPNDIFNTYNFLDFDYEERPGCDAVQTRYLINARSNLEMAWGFAGSKGEILGGIKYLIQINQWDVQAIIGLYNDHLTLGTSWAGHIKEAGFKGEFQLLRNEVSPIYNITSELDYMFKKGWYGKLGFLYNSSGKKGHINNRNDLMFRMTPLQQMPAAWNMELTIQKEWTPLIKSGTTIIYSPLSNILLIVPTGSVSLSDDWEANLVLQHFFLKEKAWNGVLHNSFIRFRYSF